MFIFLHLFTYVYCPPFIDATNACGGSEISYLRWHVENRGDRHDGMYTYIHIYLYTYTNMYTQRDDIPKEFYIRLGDTKMYL